MSTASISLPVFKFVRVEDFFSDIDSWNQVTNVIADNYDTASKTLALQVGTTAFDLKDPILLIRVLTENTFRIRFNPGKTDASDYVEGHSRTLVTESPEGIAAITEPFTVDHSTASPGGIQLTTKLGGVEQMRITVSRAPYRLQVENFEKGRWVTVVRDSNPAILFRRIDVDGWASHDWSIVFAREKFAYTKYIGFGEKGGGKLCHNSSQLTYFNFDNMRYQQVYGRGPLDPREPLYDTTPFYLEVAASPGSDSVAGTFIDNHSEICLDIGFLNTTRVLLGSFFGDMDVYQITDATCVEVFQALVDLIGKPQLKPRYVLGYHQGCYGYESRDTLLAVARAYRQNGFPFDGLHIDVDIQNRYQTFTIDTQKFPDPKGMFAELRNLGVKCSTNITPVISNRDESYRTYIEGRNQGYFISDNRVLSHQGQIESHQNYQDGSERTWSNYNGRINSGQPFEGEVYYGGDRGTPGHYPDFGRKEVRIWWGKQYEYLFDVGLEFVWQDMTSPCIRDSRGDMRALPFDLLLTDDSVRKFELDGTSSDDAAAPDYPKSPCITIQSLFSYNLHKATYLGLNHLPSRAGRRNFIIGRGAFAGVQRFAALWTGDNASDWDFYRINVAQVIGLGMSGQPMSGADIGGFEAKNGESWVDPELFIRWMIAGAFLPWFRNHYIAKGVKQFQEPYRFAEVIGRVPEKDNFIYASVLPVTRYYVSLRYRLLQLFYDALFENTCNGIPIVRPLFLHDDSDKALFGDKLEFLDNEFLVGKDLLVAPVTDPQSVSGGSRQIYLPAGSDWYLFMNAVRPLGSPEKGGSTIRFGAWIDPEPGHIGFILPMYVRAGAIIPTIELEQFVGERHRNGEINPVTLHVYPGVSGTYMMYLDDGVSRASAMPKPAEAGGDPEAKGKFQKVHITHQWLPGVAKQREIKIDVPHDGYHPREEFIFLAVHHDPSELKAAAGPIQAIHVDGSVIDRLDGGSIGDRSRRLWESADDKFYYHEGSNSTYLKVYYRNAAKRVELSYL